MLLCEIAGAGKQFVTLEVPPFWVEFVHRMPIHGLLTDGRMRQIAIGSQARMTGGVEFQQPAAPPRDPAPAPVPDAATLPPSLLSGKHGLDQGLRPLRFRVTI